MDVFVGLHKLDKDGKLCRLPITRSSTTVP